MLWKKESNKNGSMYVDLFALNGGQSHLDGVLRHIRCKRTDTTFNKNDAIALKKRNEGNEYFKQGKLDIAMEMYSESLCYAENGSKNISLAYANRSSCFLKTKHYNKCLNDIELAKAAGYPSDLMPKLDRRKEECLKGIAKGAQPVKFESKLSFEPDEHFPSMANVLKIGTDDEGELVIVAKEDIDVGQIVAVEKVFMGYIYSWHGSKCNVCMKVDANLMPCKKCTVAMFCSEECQSNSLHEYECGRKACKCDVTNNNIMRVVRSCLLTIDMFSSADDLMTFVEKAISSDRKEIPSSLSDMKSQYEAFLRLPIGSKSTIPKDVLCVIYEAYNMLLSIPKFKAMITSEKHRRFLVHLISHHYQTVDLNSVISTLKFTSKDDECTCGDDSHMKIKWASSQTGLISRFFKHSCAPNIYDISTNGNTVIITVRPIKKGQQLTKTVLLRLLTQSKKERKQVLWQERKMKCKCVRCKGHSASLAECEQILTDPDFHYICEDRNDELDHDFDTFVEERVNKCKSLLRKYGQFPWCTELGEIVEVYIYLLCIQKKSH